MKYQFFSSRPESVDPANWNDWLWQMRHTLSGWSQFANRLKLSEGESQALKLGAGLFQTRITPYALSLVGAHPEDPIRRMLVPRNDELNDGTQVEADPLAEQKHQVVPRVVHRYPDRVLLLVTDVCSTYCRYCTRKHFTGQEQALWSPAELEGALSYLRAHPGVREVILSGGDPLTLSNSRLEQILSALRAISHIEIIRVGTRMPVICPMRVDPALSSLLRRFAPLYLMTHFNHPRELTAESAQALALFVDSGIPVLNQTVLLNGVNNSALILQALFRRLVYLRVKPYYAFTCDPSPGTDHLRVSLREVRDLQKQLWGTLSGLAMPSFSLDLPGGGGKVGLVPDFAQAGENTFVGFDGVAGVYRDPEAAPLLPQDESEYAEEWKLTVAAKELPLGEELKPEIFGAAHIHVHK